MILLNIPRNSIKNPNDLMVLSLCQICCLARSIFFSSIFTFFTFVSPRPNIIYTKKTNHRKTLNLLIFSSNRIDKPFQFFL